MKKIYLVLLTVFMGLFSHAQEPFIMTWEVEDSNLGIIIPVSSGNYNYTVDFGDGTVINIINSDATHTYTQAGIYTVQITGDFPRIDFSSESFSNAQKLKTIEQWGDIEWTSMREAFVNCSNLVINATDAPDLSQVTNLSRMFRGASSLNQSINHWDVSNITNMEHLFSEAVMFNQPLNNWDVSNVQEMDYMFYNATNFNQSLDDWDVSSVNSMNGMFYYAINFNQPINSWDVTQVTDMQGMFNNATAFNQPLSNWNTTNLSDLNEMFRNAISFNQPLDNWDVSNVNGMYGVFYNASSFNGALNGWDVSNVQQLNDVFFGASAFNQPLDNWNVSNVYTMNGLFSGASSFNQPIDNWNVSNVVSMSQLFRDASSFDQPLNSWNVSNVSEMAYLFSGASVFNQSLNNWDVSNVNSMGYMFQNASTFNQPINNWNVSNVGYMRSMFEGASAFNQPLDNWNVSNVNSMRLMFAMTNFNQSINNWDVSNVQNMVAMFQNAPMFNQPLNNWDISNVSSLNGMFENAISFNQDIGGWNISNVSGMNAMFYNAYAFNQDLSSWQFNNGLYLSQFLSYSGLDIQNYDALLLQFLNLELTGFSTSGGSPLGAVSLEYCNQDVVDTLISNYGWSISNSLAENCYTIQGNVWYDQNSNGCDTGDIPVNSLFVNANGNTVNYARSINNGTYNLSVSNTTLTLSINDLPDYFNVTPQNASVDFSMSSTEQVDFCLTANQAVEDLMITMLPINDARPGFEANYKLIIQNIGTETVSGVTTTLTFDNTMQSFISSIPLTENTTENTLVFSLGEIQPFENKEISVVMQTFAPPTVNGDDILSFTAVVAPNTTDYTPENNMYNLEQVVVNSYDPNDKNVLQGETITFEETEAYLDYIIRFQNTGSASAINVRLEDNLHPNLDWNTLKVTNASHNYVINVTNGNNVEILFDNIYLPHEAADEVGSNGYIAYKIKPKSNIQVGDIMSGNASIYFDYNLPIITNTVATEVVEQLSVSEYIYDALVKIYPNPTDTGFYIDKTSHVNISSLTLYDLKGIQVFHIKQSLEYIDTSSFTSGIYILQLDTDKGSIHKKVIIE